MPDPPHSRAATREAQTFASLIHAALGPRIRLTRDPEGWPRAPGRAGHLEWRGHEWDTGHARIYAYTNHPRLIPKLRAIPGVVPKQIGDTEAAFWIDAANTPALHAVAALFHLRTRRPPSSGRSAAHMADIRPRRSADFPDSP